MKSSRCKWVITTIKCVLTFVQVYQIVKAEKIIISVSCRRRDQMFSHTSRAEKVNIFKTRSFLAFVSHFLALWFSLSQKGFQDPLTHFTITWFVDLSNQHWHWIVEWSWNCMPTCKMKRKKKTETEELPNLLRNVLQKCINESLQSPCCYFFPISNSAHYPRRKISRAAKIKRWAWNSFYSVCLARWDRTFASQASRFFSLLCSYFFLSECHIRGSEKVLEHVTRHCWMCKKKIKKKKFFVENLNKKQKWKKNKVNNYIIFLKFYLESDEFWSVN